MEPFPHTNRTVIRAGFGMYNDLQDASVTGPIRTRRSIQPRACGVAVSSFPILNSAPDSVGCANWCPAESSRICKLRR